MFKRLRAAIVARALRGLAYRAMVLSNGAAQAGNHRSAKVHADFSVYLLGTLTAAKNAGEDKAAETYANILEQGRQVELHGLHNGNGRSWLEDQQDAAATKMIAALGIDTTNMTTLEQALNDAEGASAAAGAPVGHVVNLPPRKDRLPN